MKRLWMLSSTVTTIVGASLLSGCGPYRLISPYDQVIDTGLQDYKLTLNVLVTEAGNAAGTADGEYSSFKKRYSELNVKIDMLAERARVDEIGDVNCQLETKALAKIREKFLVAAAELQAPPNPENPNGAMGCMERLVRNTKKQLVEIQKMHAGPEFCAWPSQPALTCVRPKAAEGALSAANQSLDAALFVLAAKREGTIQ